MAITKTWLTTSRNPRDTHGKIAGDTVGIAEEFGNGLMYPGDGNQGPEEVANCKCVMIIGGKVSRRSPVDRQLDETLNFGELREGQEIGHGVNSARFGTADDVEVVIKDMAGQRSEIMSEMLAQDFNDAFGFGVKMPRVAQRGTTLVSEKVQAETVYDLAKANGIQSTNEATEFLVKTFTVEERQAMSFFDEVIANSDRHLGNYMMGADGELIAIDHGLSFGRGHYSEVYHSLTRAQRELTVSQRGILEDILDQEDDLRELWMRRFTEAGLDTNPSFVTRAEERFDDLIDRIDTMLRDDYY